jgi:hypothetical protein
MKVMIMGCIAAMLLLSAARPAVAQGRKLSDGDLDKVSAGSTGSQNSGGAMQFSFEGRAGSSHTVKGNGSISVKEGALPQISSNLLLQDNAQQNLRSLVNIVAVNSKVQVLVNLNISINSTVGAVHQANAALGH